MEVLISWLRAVRLALCGRTAKDLDRTAELAASESKLLRVSVCDRRVADTQLDGEEAEDARPGVLTATHAREPASY